MRLAANCLSLCGVFTVSTDLSLPALCIQPELPYTGSGELIPVRAHAVNDTDDSPYAVLDAHHGRMGF